MSRELTHAEQWVIGHERLAEIVADPHISRMSGKLSNESAAYFADGAIPPVDVFNVLSNLCAGDYQWVPQVAALRIGEPTAEQMRYGVALLRQTRAGAQREDGAIEAVASWLEKLADARVKA